MPLVPAQLWRDSVEVKQVIAAADDVGRQVELPGAGRVMGRGCVVHRTCPEVDAMHAAGEGEQRFADRHDGAGPMRVRPES